MGTRVCSDRLWIVHYGGDWNLRRRSFSLDREKAFKQSCLATVCFRSAMALDLCLSELWPGMQPPRMVAWPGTCSDMHLSSRLILLLLLFPVSVQGQVPPSQSDKTFVLLHVTVIDATGAVAKPDMSVVIDGGRIVELDRTGRVRLPKDALVVDASGKFLIPGLWDMHVHEWNKEVFFPLFLANGITGVRDMFSP